MDDLFIYFVRHGQSVANERRVFQGGEAALTPLGMRQAQVLAERLQRVPADIILSSPMPRAHDTAKAIQELKQIPLEVCDLLREYVPPASLVDLPLESVEGQDYKREKKAHQFEEDWRYAEEESYLDMHHRACDALTLLEHRSERRIIVVSHAGLIRVMLTAMLTERRPDISTVTRFARFLIPANTGISLCRFRPGERDRNAWRLIAWNDHAHIATTNLDASHEDEVHDLYA